MTSLSGSATNRETGRKMARPNHRLQLPGAPVPSSARVLIADDDQRNVEFDSAGESPAAEA
jgi:hypothetical protein